MVTEFTAEPLLSPMSYQDVAQGEFATANFTPETTHLATFGIYTCKAVTLYNPETQFGVMAHIDGTTKVERIMEPILDAYVGNISDAEASVIQAVESEDVFLWPSLETIAEFLMRYNPKSLQVDKNVKRLEPRAVALSLETGRMYETHEDDEIVLLSKPTLIPSKPLRSNDVWL